MTAYRARGISRAGLSVAFTLAMLLSGCDKAPPDKKPSTNSEANSNSGSTAPTPDVATPTKPASKWSYTEDVDKMRGTKTRFADIESENELTFGFPYKGGKATLTLRQRPSDGLNVLLRVEGQFICSTYSDDTVAVKFDNGSIEHYTCGEPAAGTTGILFIEGAKRFVAKLKKAHSVTIEAQFFQAGARQMEFDVAGLEWK